MPPGVRADAAVGRGDDCAGHDARIPLPGGGRPGAARLGAGRAGASAGTASRTCAQGLAACLAAEARLDHPYFLALLADAYSRDAQAAEGLRVLDDALALVRDSRRFFYEAELHRLRGGCSCRQQRRTRRARPRRAISKPWPWRGARTRGRWSCAPPASLSGLWRDRARAADARALLAETLGQLTEGFTTSDYQAARTLLGELGEHQTRAFWRRAPVTIRR